MVITRLMGGLGNQMFQYAFAKKISLLSKRILKLDLSHLDNDQFGSIEIKEMYKKSPEIFKGNGAMYRNYELDYFNIDESFIGKKDICNYIKIEDYSTFYSDNLSNFYKNIQSNKNIYLIGYWQNNKYFQEINDIIKKDFSLRKEIDIRLKDLLNDIKLNNSIMIHVRRGDYLNNNHHGVISVDYVNKSKKIIENAIKSPKYYIFSDDPEWCEDNLISNNTVVIKPIKDIHSADYLELMKNCNHFIISNSTYSWWAAWLSNNNNKIIIYPKKWINVGSHQITEQLGWIEIE